MTSFFEGPEKKVELVVGGGARRLRSLGHDTWRRVAKAAQATVLSIRSNEYFDAYLLSESSLFVYDDHATMITCGQTRLVSAVLAMVELVGHGNVELLVYERKNEHFPALQHSTFLDDARLIEQVLPGELLRFGNEHAHCIETFISGRNYKPVPGDVTLEVLMHGLCDKRAALFCTDRAGRNAAALGLDRLIPSAPFTIDEHAFEPAGYSLNALHEASYYTIHVTPELHGSYASFETNWDFRGEPSALVARVVAAFEPESFDVFAFVPSPTALECSIEGYLPRKQVRAQIAGYEVSFRSFFAPRGLEDAQPIELA